MTPTTDEINIADSLLQDAKILRDLESATRAMAAGNSRAFESVAQAIKNRGASYRNIFFDLMEQSKKRVAVISELSAGDARLFRDVFEIEPPKGLKVYRRPYVVQFSMEDSAFRALCASKKLKGGYDDVPGLCPAPHVIASGMRESLGNAVTIIKSNYTVENQDGAGGKTPHMPDAARNPYEHADVGPRRIRAKVDSKQYTMVERHEELHGYQGLLASSGYVIDSESLFRELFEEEAAECIAEAETGRCAESPARDTLVHTVSFNEFDMEESRDNMPELIERLYPENRTLAKTIANQRARVEDALNGVYSSASKDLKILVGWAMHAIDFYTAHRIMPAMQKVYEAS